MPFIQNGVIPITTPIITVLTNIRSYSFIFALFCFLQTYINNRIIN